VYYGIIHASYNIYSNLHMANKAEMFVCQFVYVAKCVQTYTNLSQ
jgi:hypothetical protein